MDKTKENLHRKDCIRTLSGIYLNVFKPTIDMIDINDIANGLSKECRWGNQIEELYTVAQHSVLVSMLVNPEHKLAALMHDASEGLGLHDIPSPIKYHIKQYKKIETNLMYLIAEKYGFTYPLEQEIKEADKTMLEWEWNYVHLKKQLPNTTETVRVWTHQESKELFLKEFYNLTK